MSAILLNERIIQTPRQKARGFLFSMRTSLVGALLFFAAIPAMAGQQLDILGSRFNEGTFSNTQLVNSKLQLTSTAPGQYVSNGTWTSPVYDLTKTSMWGWFWADQDIGGFENISVNGGFEIDTDGNGIPDGWTHYPGVTQRDTNNVASGTYSLKIDPPDFPSGGVYHIYSPVVPVQNGQTLHILTHLTGDINEGGLGIQIAYTDSAGNIKGSLQPSGHSREVGSHFESGTILYHTFTVSLPSGANSLRIDLAMGGGGPVWVDDIQIFADSATKLETKTSNDNVTWSSWETARPFFNNKIAIGSTQGKFIQFRLTLTTPSSSWTPQLSAVHLSYANAFPFSLSYQNVNRKFFSPQREPAGSHGFVVVDPATGKLKFQDGTEAKFWASQNCDTITDFGGNNNASHIAKLLDAYGFNMLKTQRGYSQFDDILDPDVIDHIDKVIAESKQRGIYVYLRFWADRRIIDAATSNFTFLDRSKIMSYYVAQEFYINPQIIQIVKDYARDLLTHVNPYTGIAIGADPAVVFIEYMNENGILQGFYADRLHGHCRYGDTSMCGWPGDIGSGHSGLLDTQFNQWLRNRYTNRTALETAWAESGKMGLDVTEDPWISFNDPIRGNTQGNVQRLLYSQRESYSRARFHDTVAFYMGVEENFYSQIGARIAEIRASLGAAPLTIGTQSFSESSRVTKAYLPNDVIDVHNYFDYSGGSGDKRLARLSQIQNPLGRGSVMDAAKARVNSKPFTITEHNQTGYTDFSAEMPIMASTYGAFQNFSMITNFAISSPSDPYEPYIDNFDPVRWVQMPVAANLFLRDIEPARTTIKLQYTSQETLDIDTVRGGLLGLGDAGFLSPEYTLLHGVGISSFDAIFDPDNPTAVKPAETYITEYGLDPNPQSPYVSDTGQLSLDTQQGLLTVNTVGTQGVIGNLSERSVTSLPNLRVDFPQTPLETQSVFVTAVDTADINTASSLLLTAVTKSEYKGLRYNIDKRQFLSYGVRPILTAGVDATVTLNLASTNVLIFALNDDGQRKTNEPIPVTVVGGSIRFNLDSNYETVWYEIEVSPAENHAPILDSIGNKSINEGAALIFNVTAADYDYDPLTFSASGLPDGASFINGLFSWTPRFDQAGTYPVTFSVSDGSLSDSETITIIVNNVNRPPVLAFIGNKSVNEGVLLTFAVSATDLDNDALTYNAIGLPAGATFDPPTKTFSWTPSYAQAGIYTNIGFSVSDGAASDSELITITVNNVNQAPILASIGNRSINEGQLLEFTVSATDLDNDVLTYNATGLPLGAAFNPSTRIFSWTPGLAQSGRYDVTFSVSDRSLSDSETITIYVGNVNQPPELDLIGNRSVNEGVLLTFAVSATDLDDDTLTYSVTGLPPGAAFNPPTKTFSWTPSYAQAGVYSIIFTVNDGLASDSESITITVNNVNRAPVLTPINNKIIDENQTLNFVVIASDPDGDPVTYNPVSNLPEGAHYYPESHSFIWTPTYSQAGVYPLIFSVTDGALTATETITITVNNVNRAPVLLDPGSRSVNENELLSFTLSASDPDNDILSYSSPDLPSGATLDANTGLFSWTPGYDQAGIHRVTFIASDSRLSDSKVITISVGNVNQPPVLGTIGDRTVNENELLSFTLSATDPDGDPLIFSITNPPPGSTFNPTTGQFNWTPGYTQAGVYNNITFRVSDSQLSDYETITITVNDVNRPPIIGSISDKTVNEGALLSFRINANDPDGDFLVYEIVDPPEGADVYYASGEFTWTPGYNQAGIYQITVNVYDYGPSPATVTFNVTVNNVNRPPTLTSPGNKTVQEKALLSFTLSASDPDTDDSLTYSSPNLPHGASLNATTGEFQWMPDYDQAGNYSVRFEVRDDKGGLDTKNISIEVLNTNRAPELASIGNKSVNESVLLSFTVSATDLDDDTLTYSATGLPAGAAFNPTAKTFSWTPGYAQAGSYPVTFTVSDSSLSDSETITITVNNVNLPPVLSPVGDKTTNEGALLEFTISATDPDGDRLTYSVDTLPSGAGFEGNRFVWTPNYDQAGRYSVTFRVSDGNGGTDSEAITITVKDVLLPDAPAGVTAYANQDNGIHILLAWQLVETEKIAGYNVYPVNTTTGAIGNTPLNSQLIEPVYYSFSVGESILYKFVVTAVAVDGRESRPSAVVSVYADSIGPLAVTDLGVTGATSTSITLSWTATGDDGAIGTATRYDLRYATVSLDGNLSLWNTLGIQAGNTMTPSISGTRETLTISGLEPNTEYYFSMLVFDDNNNTGGFSNEVVAKTSAKPGNVLDGDSGTSAGGGNLNNASTNNEDAPLLAMQAARTTVQSTDVDISKSEIMQKLTADAKKRMASSIRKK